MVLARAQAEPARLAMREKRYGVWRGISWGEFGAQVRRVAASLVALGIAPGERACILADNCPEWVYADFAVMAVGGVCAGIYPTCPPAQVEYHLTDSECRIVFVEDDEQLDKILEVRDRAPKLVKIVVFDMTGLHDFSDPQVVGFDDFLELGRDRHAELAVEVERRLAERRPEDAAIIVYTSGTTGPPKGAQISHYAAMLQMSVGAEALGFDERDERLSYLPLCHAAERIWGSFMAHYTRSTVNFVENLDTLMENAGEVRPTIMLAVPRIWEKFHSFITLRVKDAPLLQRLAYRAALALGRRRAELRREGKRIGFGFAAIHWIAQVTVLNNIRSILGLARCRLAITGAAPVSPELIHWYRALGLDMIEGYGQTEASGMIAIGLPHDSKPGTVGRALPFYTIKLSERGEILVSGPSVFMGYLNRPDATRGTVADGWLHTGDIGTFDDAGNLKITDRLKDVIITAGGKNVSPSEIENQLKFSPYVSDAIVIGDRRKFLTALIVIDHENVDKFAQERSVSYTDFASLCSAAEVKELIWGEIERVNKSLARVETVKRFRIIEHMLTPEDEEMTPTMKLKRKYINQVYADMIDSMYREAE